MRKTNIAFASNKSRQTTEYSPGPGTVVATSLELIGERLCEALDLRAGARVLDVAAGHGYATLSAARRGCDVTAVDRNPALFEAARKRAEAEGLTVQFSEGDPENLPFPDRSFDVVLSAFGILFTPDDEKTAAELVRVCKPGGTIGLASWAPPGFGSRLFQAIGKYLPNRTLVLPSESFEAVILTGVLS
jgi:ubiquinone/menaquinone biosynthesis C-methylase UbiE